MGTVVQYSVTFGCNFKRSMAFGGWHDESIRLLLSFLILTKRPHRNTTPERLAVSILPRVMDESRCQIEEGVC